MGMFRRKRAAAPNLGDFDTAIRFLMAKHAPDGEQVIEGANDSLLVGDARTNLGNLRRRWSELAEGDRLPWLEASLIDMGQRNDKALEFDPARLLPGVRSAIMLETAPLLFAAQSGHLDEMMQVPRRPLAGDLNWVVIWDSEHTMNVVNKSQLDGWDRDFETAFDIAKRNFAPKEITEWGVIEDRVFSPVNGDDYLGSQLFSPGGLDGLPFSEERVVFLPTRTTALIASAADPEGIALAAELTRKVTGAANPVSLKPLVGRNDEWRSLQLHESHPGFVAWKNLSVIDDLNAYETQKGLLQEVLGDDIFVASFKAVESGGTPVSIGTWTRGAPCLLPKCDIVAFVDLEGDAMFLVRWESVMEICGARLEKTNYLPHRWRVVDFPDADELAQLRSAEVNLT